MDFVLWITFWILFYGVAYFLLYQLHFSYFTDWWFFVLYWLFGVCIVFWMYIESLYSYFADITSLSLAVFGCSYLFAHLLCYVIPKHLARPQQILTHHPKEYFLHLSHRHLFVNTPMIFFQQLLIFVLLLSFIDLQYSLSSIMIFFALFFPLMHLHMFKKTSFQAALYFVAASFAAGIVFPFLIFTFASGLLYAYALHFLSYPFAASVVWMYQARKKH